MSTDPVFISEAADRLDRKIGTLRKWERDGRLPEQLRPHRDERNHRYWTEEQIEGIKTWMVEVDLRPGKGLPHNSARPNDAKIAEHLARLRQPRK